MKTTLVAHCLVTHTNVQANHAIPNVQRAEYWFNECKQHTLGTIEKKSQSTVAEITHRLCKFIDPTNVFSSVR